MGLQTGRGGETIRKPIVKLADGAGSRQTTGRICQRDIERSPFSTWAHFALAAAEGARRATGAAANGARREAGRERLTVRGHLLRGIFLPSNSGQFRAIPGNSGQASSDWAAGAAVRAAVFGGATLAHPRRTERPFRPLICEKDAPSMRLGRSSSARSARASCAALFDKTNAPRARQPGGAGQTAAGSAGEGLDTLAGLAARGRAGRSCRRYEEQTSSQTNGRDITSSIFFFAFFFVRARMPAARGGRQPQQRAPRRREVDLDDSRLPVVMLCRPGRQKQD